MSDVTVSIKMSAKKAGAMYMQLMKAEDRIEELETALKEVMDFAEYDCIDEEHAMAYLEDLPLHLKPLLEGDSK